MSESEKLATREIVDELLKNDIIQESNSPYASPVLLVDKPSGEKRMCVDYRSLNKITVKEKYPMPIVEDLIDKLKGCKYYTSLDLKSGYYQINVHKDSIAKTAFITPDGHYEFRRMPFGLCNGPSVFQRLMNTVLATAVPRSNGQVERYNRTILDSLRTMGASTDNNKWDIHIPRIQQGINSTINKTTAAIPSEVFFGYRLQTDADKLMNEDIQQPIDMTSLRNSVSSRIQDNAEKQKQAFDSKRKPARTYDMNDLVVIKIPSQSNEGQSTKLLPVFKGPFQVTEVLGHDRYKVKDMRGAERTKKRYEGTTCAENMKPWIRLEDLNENNLDMA
ncbi:hypothetical protein ABMA28_000388 [Loxostege sticticalis]|uniref:Reverse transcriptase domain-containing protein n=1 Tax=Loxostege sticticalis TaxID=481309 RepID=A0ABD0TS29_LOXSC